MIFELSLIRLYIAAEYPAIFTATIEQCVNHRPMWALTNVRAFALLIHPKLSQSQQVWLISWNEYLSGYLAGDDAWEAHTRELYRTSLDASLDSSSKYCTIQLNHISKHHTLYCLPKSSVVLITHFVAFDISSIVVGRFRWVHRWFFLCSITLYYWLHYH